MLRALGGSEQIGKSDLKTFMYITFIVLAIGIITVILYHVMVRMPNAENDARRDFDNWTSTHAAAHAAVTNREVTNAPQALVTPAVPETRYTSTWKKHLSDELFYRVAILYIAGRIYYVITETYQSVFLQYTLKTRKVSLFILSHNRTD